MGEVGRGSWPPAGFLDLQTLPELDVGAALAAAPAEATVKGLVIQSIVDRARADGRVPEGRAFGQRWFGFKDYPLRDYMEIALGAARTLHPGRSTRDALREVGRGVFDGFMQSLSGRVVLGVVRNDPLAVMRMAGRAYALTQSHGRVDLTEANAQRCVLEYRGLYQFLDSLEVGVIEAGAALTGHDCTIWVRHDAPGRGALAVALKKSAPSADR